MKRIVFFFYTLLLVILWTNVSFAQELKEGRYPDGKLRYRGYFQNGEPAGEVTHYYPDGNVKAVMNHKGEQVEAVLYSKNGEFKTSGKYLNRKKNGVWEYHKNDVLVLSEEYEADRLNGTTTRYYAGGGIAEIKNWKAGVLSGDWKLFYDSGKLRMEVPFVAGLLNGKMKSYDYQGILTAEGEYQADLKEGEWCFYTPTGKLERTLKFHQGIPENKDEIELEESRQIDALTNSGKKIPDPALFADDPENYIKLSNLLNR